MTNLLTNFLCWFIVTAGLSACNNITGKKAVPEFTEEYILYAGDSTIMSGFVVYNKNDTAKRPAVLVVPEWWGMNEYAKIRARKLAALGYIAMAVDVYGNGKTADNPDSAGAWAAPFYQNPLKAKLRVDAAITRLREYPQTDTSRIGAIGYCFGGGVLLNTVRLGDSQLKGIVSFHGSLLGTPARKDLLRSRILVCHGGADPFVPQQEVNTFKSQMDSIGAAYMIKVYDSATHAFTNPEATALGVQFRLPIRYNAKADTASWNDMKGFFREVFKQ